MWYAPFCEYEIDSARHFCYTDANRWVYLSDTYDELLPLWQRVMIPADLSPEGLARMKAAYLQNVAILLPSAVAAVIASGGFVAPVQFFQAGLLHVWFAGAC